MRRLVLLAASVTLAAPAYAQAEGDVVLTFNHVALYVADIDRSADFYGRVLKLPEISRASRATGVRWFSLGEGKELHLISPEYVSLDSIRTNKAVHLALTTNHFADLLRLLDSRGIAYGDWNGTSGVVNTRSDGVSQIFLQDPDGYWIEINSVGER